MEHPLNPPPAQRALSVLSNSTHLHQKSEDVRPHQWEHVAHMRQSLGILFAILSCRFSIYTDGHGISFIGIRRIQTQACVLCDSIQYASQSHLLSCI